MKRRFLVDEKGVDLVQAEGGEVFAKKCQEVGSSFPGRKEKKERRPWRFLAVIFQETSEAKCWPRLPTGRVVMVPGDCSQGM